MKVLTVKQPWAFLIVKGLKDVENRSWFTNYEGPLLIHASKTWDQSAMLELRCLAQLQAAAEVNRHFTLGMGDVTRRHPDEFGAIVGRVILEGCYHHSVPMSSPWAGLGCWHWKLHTAEQFEQPVKVTGHQGLWEHKP